MNFKKGDKVAVIDATIRGKVYNVNNNTISVKSTDGFEYQFLKKELVKIETEQIELSKYLNIDNVLLKNKTELKPKKKSLFKKNKNEIIMEVDLHIEKLVKSTKGMDNFDILSRQLAVVKHKVEYCISKRIYKLVFIHGVGDGVLKSELHTILNRYPVSYCDASYVTYGLGATEIKLNLYN